MALTEAMYYECRDGSVECGLCPVNCHIKDGQAGLCRVRTNQGGKLFTETYGNISALHIDPVEKKPLKRFMPGTETLSIGSFGCNMRCPFCQNHDISQERPQTQYLSPEALIQLAKRYHLPSISYTYNEPTMFYEYMLASARLARQNGLKNIVVTNGYISKEPLTTLLPFIDAMNIDLKCFSEQTYRKLGGSLKAVMDTIETCAQRTHVEVTMLVVTKLNDDPNELRAAFEALAKIKKDMPLHLTRYFPRYQYKEKATEPSFLYHMADIARQYLSDVYVGNV